MNPDPGKSIKRRRWERLAAVGLAVASLAIAARLISSSGWLSEHPADPDTPPPANPQRSNHTDQQHPHARWNEMLSFPLHPRGPDASSPSSAPPPILAACTSCHRYPAPDLLPRKAWAYEINTMFDLAERAGRPIQNVTQQRVTQWFERHAPEQLPHATDRTDAGPGPIRWKQKQWRPRQAPSPRQATPAIAHLGFTPLPGASGSRLLVCDMRFGGLFSLDASEPNPRITPLGTAGHPSYAETCDLDGDGRRDLVVADIGEIHPSPHSTKGRILWLKGRGNGRFESYTLAKGLGRIAEIRAADLDDDGDTDLIVSVFGWVEKGQLFWLENIPGDNNVPRFQRHRLDPRPGTVRALPVDLNGDGRLDIAALVSQHAEQVIAHVQTDDGFTPKLLHEAPHPDWGYTGMEPVDLDSDGDTDLLLTNGDAMDAKTPKPHHGVAWLENRGDLSFRYHHLTHLYGAHRALPADLDGDGDLDIVACALVPPGMRKEGDPPPRFESLIWLERLGPDRMIRRVLKRDDPDHATLAANDYDDDGDTDLVLGHLSYKMQGWEPIRTWLTFWENRGLDENSPTPEQPDPDHVINIFNQSDAD